jgi:Cu2+-exporting ATPase
MDHSKHKMNHQGMDHNKIDHGKHENHQNHHAHMVEDFKKRFWVSLIFTAPILVLSPMIQKFLKLDEAIGFNGDKYVLFILATFIFFYGGWPFLKGMYDELKRKNPGMMTLIAVAISTAYIYSSAVVFGLVGKLFFWELVTLIDIMLLGHWIEMRSVMGASRALEELAKLVPGEAHMIMEDGMVHDVPTGQLKPGDKVLVKPGEKIPVDGVVYEGETSVNESMLTGESKPVSKKEEDGVIGGAINGEGSIKVTVQKIGEDSFLSQVIKLVKEAQNSKSKTQDLANRAAFWLTIIGLSSGALTFFIWLLFTGEDLVFAIERTVTVMVITCPHALGLAVPLVVAVSTSLAAKNGFLIRNRTAFENARNIQAIVFDKTGTLTKGEFGITETVILDKNYTNEEIIKLAASVEGDSEHPIAKGIVKAVSEKYEVKNFKAIPGKGAEGMVEGKMIRVVSPGYLRENNIDAENREINKLYNQGKTVVFVLLDKQAIGAIALADIIREESKKAIEALKVINIKSIMLTGDNKQVAHWVSQEIGIDEYFAEVLPGDKAKKVKEIQDRGLVVAMTGDGVNPESDLGDWL